MLNMGIDFSHLMRGLSDETTTPIMDMPKDFAPHIQDTGNLLFYRAWIYRDNHYPYAQECAMACDYDPGERAHALAGMRQTIWQATELFRLGYTETSPQ